MPKRISLLLLISMLLLAACRQEQPAASEDINIQIAFEPAQLFVTDDSTVIVTLTDNAGNAITDATVNVRGDMSHAGMTPVLRDIETDVNGIYTSDYEWTMAGDWEVVVNVMLPDGTATGETFAFTVAGDMSDMEDMDMGTQESDMDDMDSTEESSE